MSQRKIFLSCVNRELRSYRLKAELIIQRRGYKPIFEETFELDDQTDLDTLTTRIAECDAVVCLVGHAYGGELHELPAGQPRRSFTQWEYFFARERNKPIYRLAAHSSTPTDDQTAVPPPAPEADELRQLQAKFREEVLNDQNFREFRNVDQLEKELALLRFPWEPGTGWRKPFVVPFGSLGSLFKGRDKVLADLHQQLQSTESHTVAVTQVLHGLGGVGKTRLAIEYAYRHANDYSAVLFASADTPSNLEANLAQLVSQDALDLPEQAAGTKPDQQAAAVLRWLKQNTAWLLILDNLDTEDAKRKVQSVFQGLAGGALLLTGRIASYPARIKVLPIEVLPTNDAASYLLQATDEERKKTDRDVAEARQLAEAMGGLSLALEQAAAFINANTIGLGDYRQRWTTGEAKLRDYYDADRMDYPRSVLVTWDTTFQQLDPAARLLLNILGWFSPEPISREVFETGNSQAIFAQLLTRELSPRAERGADAPPLSHGDLEGAFATLKKYSLVVWDPSKTSVSVHRLVQEVTRQRQTPDEQTRLVSAAANLLNAFLPNDPPPQDVRSWKRWWEPAKPHVAAVVAWADERGIAEPTSRLMNDLGLFNKATNRLAEAEPLMKRALAIDEQSFGTEHPNVAIRLNNLALLLQATNRLTEAEPLMKRALAIDEQSFGTEHPNVATDLNNLARLLQHTNRLAEAEPLMRRQLMIFLLFTAKTRHPHPHLRAAILNYFTLAQALGRAPERFFIELQSMSTQAGLSWEILTNLLAH